MAIIEIALLKLKKELIKDLEEKVVPTLNIKLNKAGVQNGLRGFFVTEHGRDSKDGEFTDVLLFRPYPRPLPLASNRISQNTEWPTFQHFKDFIASSDYHEFSSEIKEGGYASGPPELRLIDVADDPSSLFGSNTVVEYLTIRPKDTSEAGVQSVLKKLQSELPRFGTSKVVVGSSLNLEPQQIALVSSYASDAVSAPTLKTHPRIHHTILYTATTGRSYIVLVDASFTDNRDTQELDAVKASTARQQLLADIASTADVTSLVAHVKKELPLAE
ncbi:hypothetical protein GGR58DRAFT_451351 [Xylaria digitata]|nr:hypothetical protein GGR58DRAFT_451351 [Xylaria digitata]